MQHIVACAFFYGKMKNLRKLILIQLTLLCVLFASCKTTEENIFTMSQESGQLVFLRPVTLDNKAFPLRKTSFDITVNIIDFELTDSNIVNYTLYFPEEYFNSFDKTEFFFKTDSVEKVTLDDLIILYKDFKKKNLEVRFSGTLPKEKLEAILENPNQTKVGITLEDKTMIFASEDFSRKLFELGVLVR